MAKENNSKDDSPKRSQNNNGCSIFVFKHKILFVFEVFNLI
jgi:hypothetical protein